MSPFCECGEGAGGEMGHLVRKWGSVGGFWGGNGGGVVVRSVGEK